MQLAVAFGSSGLFGGGGLMKLGIMAATSLGGMMFRKKISDKQAGKLNDLKVSSSTYGKGIPEVWGTMRVTGNMFWATDFEEEKKYYNSKGKDITDKKKAEKKGQKKFEYFANFAMGLCAGPVDELLRIWADSNLIYDKYNPEGYKDSEGVFHEVVKVGFSQGEDSEGGKGKGGKGKGGDGGDRFNFEWFNGSEEQFVHPFMQEKTKGRAPAHRGMAYLFFRKMPLMDFGNRTPTITAEVTVKKRRLPNYSFFKDVIDQADDEGTPNAEFAQSDGWVAQGGYQKQAFMDAARYRLYSVGTVNGIGQVLRVYDLTDKKEQFRQIPFSEMGSRPVGQYTFNQIGGLIGVIDTTVGSVIGVACNGDLVCAPAGASGNGRPILFVDATTFQIKDVWGYWSAVLQDEIEFGATPNETKVWSAWKTQAQPVAFLEVGLDGTPSSIPYTAIMSWYDGGVMWFDQYNQPVDFVHGPGGRAFDALVPGLGDLGGSQFYARDQWGSQYANLWRCSTNRKEWKLIFTVTRGEGDYGVWMGDPFVSAGARCVGVICGRYSHDPKNNGTYFYKLDPMTGDILWFKKVSNDVGSGPDQARMQNAGFVTGSKYMWLDGKWVYEVDLFYETFDKWEVPAAAPKDTGGGQFYLSTKGAIIFGSDNPAATTLDSLSSRKNERWAMAEIDRISQSNVSIKKIATDMARLVGIREDMIDATQMDETEVGGYLLENPAPARAVIEDLSKTFFFDVVESDGKLKFISRGKSPVKTVTQDELGIISDQPHENTQEYYKETKVQEIDCPARVTVSFVNKEKEYENGSQHYSRPRSPMPVMQTNEALDLNLPIAMDKDMAKQMAQKACLSIWTERITHDVVLPWDYIIYDPTDVFTFEMDNGLTFTDRMLKMDLGADYTIEAAGVSQVASTFISNIKGMRAGGFIPVKKFMDPVVQPVVLDIPYMSDADDLGRATFHYYWGIGALRQGFRAGALESRIGASDWYAVGGTNQDVIWGRLLSPLPAPPHGPFATDDVNTMTLFPAWDISDVYEWESITDGDWPTDTNVIVYGKEIIYFKNAEVNGNGSITLSTLIRGARGTEAAAYTHTGLDVWYVPTEGALELDAEELQYVNVEYNFRAQTPGSILGGLGFSQKHMLTGAPEKPWAPNDIRRTDNNPGAGDVLLTWQRRTRLGGAGPVNGTASVPLNEDYESYQVYVLDQPYDPATFDPDNEATFLRRMDALATRQVTYSAGSLSTDGLSVDDPLHLVIYQVSEQVGRGFPGWTTVYPTILL